MQKKFQDIVCLCEKPLFTVHCGKGFTVTSLGAAVVVLLVVIHVTVCKFHAISLKCKEKKLKGDE